MTDIGKDIDKAADLLLNGQLVAIPTETVYGLAANALNIDAVTQIFEVKRRPQFDPLIVHCAGIDQIYQVAEDIDPSLERLMSLFTPGPLTVLCPRSMKLPGLVNSGLTHVAVRIPDHPLTLKLLKQLDFPLAAPSANPFGYISPTTAQHVSDQLGGLIPYILDGGPCQVGLESTVVGCQDEEIVIYRKGAVTEEMIAELGMNVRVQSHSSSNPRSPGQLQKHYSPRTEIRIIEAETFIELERGKRIGLLAYRKGREHIPEEYQRILSPTGDLRQAAQNFFSHLRELDALKLDYILAETAPESGLGRAINDKLRRAAQKS